MKIIAAVLLFSIIVIFHELGHFLVARLCRVYVEEFCIGMGPRLLAHRAKSGTVFSIRLLPFGGACMMRGEDTLAEEDPEEDGQTAEETAVEEHGQDGSFQEKTVWQRLAIVAAGPVFNFILAALFAAVIIGFAGYDAPIVYSVTGDYPAAEAGLQAGDTITSIGGKRVTLYRDLSDWIDAHQTKMKNGEIELTWLHDGEKKSAMLRAADNGSGRYVIGITGGLRYSAEGNVLTIARYSLSEVRYWIEATISGLKMIGQGEVTLDDVSGPVGVVQVIGETYEETKSEGTLVLTLNLLYLAVLLSANLGVMNLLPIPALDGGRILLLLAEAVTRKRLSPKVEGYINLAGFMFLMMIMAVVLMNDTRKLL